jgi:hypothetical protein
LWERIFLWNSHYNKNYLISVDDEDENKREEEENKCVCLFVFFLIFDFVSNTWRYGGYLYRDWMVREKMHRDLCCWMLWDPFELWTCNDMPRRWFKKMVVRTILSVTRTVCEIWRVRFNVSNCSLFTTYKRNYCWPN